MPQQPASNPLGQPFIELQSVDSTNNYALSLIHAGLAHHGHTFFAHEQVSGKGQRGRTWSAEKDANILLSVVVKPHPLQVSQQFQLSACASVAVREFFSIYGGDDTRIKWPNDLYWQDRKAGGILIENVIKGLTQTSNTQNAGAPWEWSVIGMGININQTSFPSILKNPVSLKQITGKQYDVVNLCKELIEILNRQFQLLVRGQFHVIYAEYLSHLYKKGERVKFKINNRVFDARLVGVSHSGNLIIHHSIEEEFSFGEIDWVI